MQDITVDDAMTTPIDPLEDSTAKNEDDGISRNPVRRQARARRIAEATYTFRCCAVCGIQIPTCLTVAHLDQQPANNEPDNLAFLCQTHHWMYDSGLFPLEAIKLLRDHWQQTHGVPCHKARMKGAGSRAAETRRRSTGAKKAWVTRRSRE